jgi:hypothetical protein
MLMLHPDGRLAYFEARPPDREEAADGDVPEPDWSALFAEAGLDMAVFAPAEPEWLGGSFADTRAAWVGPGADASGGELRVEAAAYRGRPVFFDLIAPWTTPLSSAPSPISTSQTINNIVGISLLFGLFTTAVGLAIRNARLGRADRQGAVRLAIAMGGLVLAATLLGSSYATWLTTLFMLVPWACFIGVLAWTFYTAVEPYVRRRWPQALISWTRLLGGRWRDPLVGRDLLLGSVLGLTGSIVGGLSVFVTDWRGVPPSAPSFAATEWSGPLDAVGSQLDSLQNAAVFGLGLLLLLVMFRILLRSERLAALGFVALFTGLAALQGTDLLVSLVIGIPTFLLLVVVVTRLGLVALVAFMFVGGGSASSLIAFTTPEFMRGPLVIVIATSLSLPLFGFFTSLSGRKAAAAKLLDD